MIDYEKLEVAAQPGWFSGEDMRGLVPEVQKLHPGQVYCEIGVHKGRSLSVVQLVKQPKVLAIGIDIVLQPELERYLVQQSDDFLSFWYASSTFAAKAFTKITDAGFVDLLFIDGDHSYHGCKNDIANWYPLMEPKGVMLFHDYDITSPGVVQAVDEFATRINRPVELLQAKSSLAKIQLC